MDLKYINSFISGFLNVTAMLGMSGIQRTGLSKKQKLSTDNDVNIIIGLAGDIRGNVVLAMHENTACKIASTMMGGMPVETFDSMPRSAISELANMMAGNSAGQLEGLGVNVNITPPTLIHGKNIISLISQVETIVVQFNGNEGPIDINISSED